MLPMPLYRVKGEPNGGGSILNSAADGRAPESGSRTASEIFVMIGLLAVSTHSTNQLPPSSPTSLSDIMTSVQSGHWQYVGLSHLFCTGTDAQTL